MSPIKVDMNCFKGPIKTEKQEGQGAMDHSPNLCLKFLIWLVLPLLKLYML